MAIALSRISGFPTFGLYDQNGKCHHAFVMLPDGRGMDIRGAAEIEQLKKGCAGQNVRPLPVDEIEIWVGRPLDRSEIAEARRAANQSSAVQYAIRELESRKTNAASEVVGIDRPKSKMKAS